MMGYLTPFSKSKLQPCNIFYMTVLKIYKFEYSTKVSDSDIVSVVYFVTCPQQC